MIDEKTYIERRIADLRIRIQWLDFSFAKQEKEYKTKIEMTNNEIYECEKRLNTINKEANEG
jgi:hypothetical protein